MEPMLIEVPTPIVTPRLLLRAYCPGDGALLHQAIVESYEQLHPWQEWAAFQPSLEQSEVMVRCGASEFIMRKYLKFLLFEQSEGQLIGGLVLNAIRWDVPRMAIGYWLRTGCTGKGYMTQAVSALTYYAFKQLKCIRLEIRCDEANIKSQAVALRAGFTLECRQENMFRDNDGMLRNLLVYVRFNLDNLAPLTVSW